MKVVKVKRSGIAAIMGILTAAAGMVMSSYKITGSVYVLQLAGFLMIMAALLFLYPILIARKDKEGNVRVITDVKGLHHVEEPKPDTEGQETVAGQKG
ncbi:isoleucyl-tRNA synthetase [Pedobacter sp. SYP-B3415]|uniref:isoleucyl-tRNA synthetase n=1 Tax=Pedobacter sp. SYP-B3415 TaxID=2496641 RepID=UPI00197E8675|nr:isoleucyl-tRNA synthetase [Pedobacter sp. SYP-B3415]